MVYLLDVLTASKAVRQKGSTCYTQTWEAHIKPEQCSYACKKLIKQPCGRFVSVRGHARRNNPGLTLTWLEEIIRHGIWTKIGNMRAPDEAVCKRWQSVKQPAFVNY